MRDLEVGIIPRLQAIEIEPPPITAELDVPVRERELALVSGPRGRLDYAEYSRAIQFQRPVYSG
jgi:hypothetical protein